jgi:hypothetical protein
MHAVVGRVLIKAGHEEETLAMIREHGIGMLEGMEGSAGGYWARAVDGDLVQHSWWLFDREADARAAGAMFGSLRDMPDAPATFVSVDVCEVVGRA